MNTNKKYQNLKEHLFTNNYALIKNFISKERALDISNEFMQMVLVQETPETNALYNFLPSLELLCEKTPLISSIIGEYVLPTYTYTRQYKNSSKLKVHKDRGSCEITLSIHLDSDKQCDWPLWIKTPSGEDKSILFENGDAVMYFGCDTFHWRDVYSGSWYNQTMIHYVTSNGKNSHRYFDLFDSLKSKNVN